ncbi:Memo family protein [Besnoitia besnoiti]|uniref:Memo family protein n=1 Tax=Besnoitia besnoiti TaxID=94643 RepID=A0A2A9MCT2_BESBE|nr:Memo family protein [Besnoitia besnoiti]PFH35024.1 Memo family protein [Besnoitia besnoiti]
MRADETARKASKRDKRGAETAERLAQRRVKCEKERRQRVGAKNQRATTEKKMIRRAAHAGSWYSSDPKQLSDLFSSCLTRVQKTEENAVALICPHAGYAYCAATAAAAWRQVSPATVRRVFVLGPSHHVYLANCALPQPSVKAYATPLGEIPLDIPVLEALRSAKIFGTLPLRDDENEHSIEMQLPFLKYVLREQAFTLVPIVVGDLRRADHSAFATALRPYFLEVGNLFVFSSDFCHWGRRFRYMYLPPAADDLPIYKRIEMLDRAGAALVERQDAAEFQKYYEETGNTICGHNPISVFLHLLEESGRPKEAFKTKLLSYSQSSQVEDDSSSSVSYAAFACSLVAASASPR